jgi:hypothetical protein
MIRIAALKGQNMCLPTRLFSFLTFLPTSGVYSGTFRGPSAAVRLHITKVNTRYNQQGLHTNTRYISPNLRSYTFHQQRNKHRNNDFP